MSKQANQKARVLVRNDGGFELNIANEQVRKDFVRSLHSFDDTKLMQAMRRLSDAQENAKASTG
ncbi:hypothetical protein [Aliidiomarina sanyensis]|uniref:Uncharacterized protein n=1 Tax=Aliidiomarina sanyensis TaxID=1249555 RepID=A0A432WGF4_9GAMM|nr:hypothetical protein [Aliidiomarina sanyensis]RUO32890.1 hypothetical protein CWE11_07625 [Aliidiomarina sanyensis]